MAVLKFFKKKTKKKTKPKTKRKAVKKKIVKRKPAKRKTVKLVKKKKITAKRIRKTPKSKRRSLASKTVISNEEFIGKITHYFPHVKAAVVDIAKGELNVGDRIHIKGHTTDFTQKVNSMQINHVSINRANKGDDIGLVVKSRVRINDDLYKVL